MRQDILMCVLGSIYKTESVMEFALSWVKSNPQGDIIAFDPHCRMRELADNLKFEISSEDREFKWIDAMIKMRDKFRKNSHNLLVLNAADLLFPKPRTAKSRPASPPAFKNLITLLRYMNMDVVVAFSKPDAMPIVLEPWITDYVVRPILQPYEINEENPNREILDSAIKSMNAYPVTNAYPYDEYLYFKVGENDIKASRGIDRKKLKKAVKTIDSIKTKFKWK